MNKNIQEIFSSISSRYELINHILTLGFDGPVRRYSAKFAVANHSRDAKRWLDVCTGTGQMAHCLKRYAGENTIVVATDFTLPMLQYASTKREMGLIFTLADSARLPFKNNMFDLVTISFATRNINVSKENLVKCLREFYRVLKPDGRFVNLETSQPMLWMLRKIFYRCVKSFVRPIGGIISGSNKAYAYLSHTIPHFYNAAELSRIISEAGFQKVSYKTLFGGIIAIHRGIK